MNFPNTQIPITYEALMASIYENDRIFNERLAKSDRFLTEKFAETDRLRKESDAKFDKYQEAYEKRMKNMEDTMGNWSNNHGSFAEEYFINSFKNKQQNFFGEEFNRFQNKFYFRRDNIEDEYDIVMYNHHSVAIIEVKFKAHKNDISKVIKKAETFRILCPDYKDFKIYLGLASLSFYDELEQECVEHGIAVIKQVGDTVVINDSGLKVF
jgi:hypothetical protein